MRPCKNAQNPEEISGFFPARRRWWAVRRRQIIIGRGLCWYRCFDLTALPARERHAALSLQIKQWSPLSNEAGTERGEVQTWIVWQEGLAMVWLWEAISPQAGSGYQIPEPLLYKRGQAELRQLALQQGYELQYWDLKGVLRFSQWSPVAFSNFALQAFFLAVDQQYKLSTIEQSWVTAQRLPLLADAWKAAYLPSLDRIAFVGQLFCGLALLALLTLIIWFTAQNRLGEQSYQTQQAALQTLRQQAAPLVELRTQALEEKQRLDSLTSLLPKQTQLQIMADFSMIIAQLAPEAHIETWGWTDGGLQVDISGLLIDQPSLVEALKAEGTFANIRIEIPRGGAKQLRIFADSRPVNANE